MKKSIFVTLLMLLSIALWSQTDTVLKKKDYKKDVLLHTNYGDMVIRLSDSTPLHRNNFLKLVKSGFFDGLLFHRVIQDFMIQGGDPNSRNAAAGVPLGMGGPGYRVPAEFRKTLFHKKGAVAAARDNNPEKASSGSQFYITKGRVLTDGMLDSLENFRLKRKIPVAHRAVYKTVGGVPHLDQQYTVFGELVKGMDVLDAIAAVETSKATDLDRPLQNVQIIKATLVKRKRSKR